MKKRSPVNSLLLSLFVPFYYLYWLYATGKIINARGGKAPGIWLLFTPSLALIGVAGLSVINSFTVNASGFNAVILLIGVLVIPALLVLPIIYDFKFSKAINGITGGRVDSGVGFVLMLFVAPAAVYIFQDKLNETENLTSQANAQPAERPLQPTGSPVFASNQRLDQTIESTAQPQINPTQQQQTINDQIPTQTHPGQSADNNQKQ